MIAGPALRVSARALRDNLTTLRERLTPAVLLMVEKDDAYGHGVAWATPLAARHGVGWFGSHDITTAVRVRAAAGPAPRVLSWATSGDDEIAAALTHGIDIGVGTMEYFRRVRALSRRTGHRARVHAKIDTGLHRNGLLAAEWADGIAEMLEAERSGDVRLVGVWSHIAEAGDAEDDAAAARFRRAVARARGMGARLEVTHLTASAASLARPELRGGLCRIGAFCYGIRAAGAPLEPGLTLVATLRAPVVAVDRHEATVGIGAWHGLPTTLGGIVDVGTPAGPRRLTAIGDDTLTVEAWPGCHAGDTVDVWGPGARGESDPTTLAESIDTIGEELATRLSPHVTRVAVD